MVLFKLYATPQTARPCPALDSNLRNAGSSLGTRAVYKLSYLGEGYEWFCSNSMPPLRLQDHVPPWIQTCAMQANHFEREQSNC